LFCLAQIGARRDAAVQPRARQLDAALRAGLGVLRDLEQARVGGIVEPGGREIADPGDEDVVARSISTESRVPSLYQDCFE